MTVVQQKKWVYLVVLTLIWGSSYILIKKSLIGLSPLQLGSIRILISTAILLLIGFSSLKGMFLSDVIRNFVIKTNWDIVDEYHFGGYGKVTDELIQFLNSFYKQTNIPLDPIYTGKMFFGILDKIKNGYFSENSKILMIHTGGLQAIKGMNFALQNKNKEIEISNAYIISHFF